MKTEVNEDVDFDNALYYHIICYESDKACSIKDYTNIVQHENSPKANHQKWRLIKLSDGNYEIMSENPEDKCRGKCLTCIDNKQQVVLQNWKVSNNDPQRWHFHKIPGSNDLYRIRANGSEYSLTVKDCSPDEDAPVVIEMYRERECQKWRLEVV
ncbi:MAG TPA: RICIN domain-containing protein [Methanosarcina sp.]